MGLMSKLLRKNEIDPALITHQQAVLVCLKLSDEEIGTSEERQSAFALADRLIQAVQTSDVGEFDDNQFEEGFCTISLSGMNADRIADAVMPVLQSYPAAPGSYVMRRYGDDGAREQSTVLGASA